MALSRGHQVGEHEAVALDHLAGRDCDGVMEHGPRVGEGVELAVFAAGVDGGGEVREEGLVEIAPGEGTIEFPRIDERRTGRPYRFAYTMEYRDVGASSLPAGGLLRRFRPYRKPEPLQVDGADQLSPTLVGDDLGAELPPDGLQPLDLFLERPRSAIECRDPARHGLELLL